MSTRITQPKLESDLQGVAAPLDGYVNSKVLLI